MLKKSIKNLNLIFKYLKYYECIENINVKTKITNFLFFFVNIFFKNYKYTLIIWPNSTPFPALIYKSYDNFNWEWGGGGHLSAYILRPPPLQTSVDLHVSWPLTLWN